MKRILKFTAILAVVMLAFSACDRHNIEPDGNEPNNDPKERVVVFTVGQNETRLALKTEGEWDALLDVLCSEAQTGQTVAFYNMSPTTYLQKKGTTGTKGTITFSTSNREEMKAWMKAREKEGLTVEVTYSNGSWHGMAYASAPPTNTSVDIVGTWHFVCSVVNHMDQSGALTGSDLYVPEEGGGSMFYTFHNDGTITLTFNGQDGTTATENSTWTLGSDGVLCCELLPNAGCWNVNWITENTMIISRSDIGTEEGDVLYQLQFERD